MPTLQSQLLKAKEEKFALQSKLIVADNRIKNLEERLVKQKEEILKKQEQKLPKFFLDVILRTYIQEKNWEIKVMEDKKFLSDMYKRNYNPIKKLFTLSEGNTDNVLRAISYVSDKSRQQGGWSWTLETVAKKFVEFKATEGQKQEGAAGREL